MFSDTRRRLVGLATAAIIPTALGFIALPAHALSPADPVTTNTCGTVPGNLVVNCGFEDAATPSGLIPGWTHLVSHVSFVSNNPTPAAHSGAQDLQFSSQHGDDVWIQTVPVTPHTQYVVGAWVLSTYGTGSPQDDLTISATNVGSAPAATTLFSSSDTAITTWRQFGNVVTTGSGRSMTIAIAGSNVPGYNFVDDVYVAPQRSGCAAIANNLVRNCGFEASTNPPASWTADTTIQNSGVAPNGGIPGASEGGTQSLYFGSGGADDAWFQTLVVRPHTTYTLTYWTEYWSGGSPPQNNLGVTVTNVSSIAGGTLAIETTNASDHVWASATRTFTTGAGSTAVLEFAGANSPGYTYVDDVSVTAVPHVKISAKRRSVTTNLTGLGGQRVMLQRLVHKHWRTFHTWTAPKTGWSKSWTLHVSPGRIRAQAQPAPGYSPATSNAITVK